MDEGAELIEMIRALKQAKIGDEKKLDFYHKIIADLGKSLQPNDRNYIVDLYQELSQVDSDLENESKPRLNLSENIDDVKEKVTDVKEEYVEKLNDVKDEYKEKLNSTAENYKEKTKNKIEESRFKLVGGQYCTRCECKLGLRKNKPEKSWGIQGNLCKSCYEHVKVNVTEFSALYKQGQFRKEQKVKGKLSIQNFDNVHRIVYGTKEFTHLEIIQAQNVKHYELVNYEEYCKRKKIMTMGFKSTISHPHLLIRYSDNRNREQELILDIKDLSNAYSSVGNLVLSNQTKTQPEKQQESFSKIKE